MSTAQKLVFNENDGDLFSAPSFFSLSHCVGADMAMDTGIAVRFRLVSKCVFFLCFFF